MIGSTSGVFDVLGATVAPRSAPALLEQHRTPRVAILGRRAAAALGVTGAQPGVQVRVGTQAMDVVGVVVDPGSSDGLADAVIVPPAVALSLSSPQDRPEESLRLRTEPGRAFAVSQLIGPVVRPGEPGTVEVEPVPDLRHLRRGIDTDLDSSATLLAVLLLVLAAITTTNVMTMSVNDRRSEIALRRAVGTPRRLVGLTFLCEGAVIGTAGGAVGGALGLLTTVSVAWRQGWDAVLPPWLVPVGVLTGVLVGLLAAGRAALRAVRVAPAVAIRG